MLLMLVCVGVLGQAPVDDPYPGRYHEDYEASRQIRQQQFDQIHRYVDRLNTQSESNRSAFFTPDYTSEEAYSRSISSYRERLQQRIGYPPPLPKTDSEPRYEPLGDDADATLYRVWYEVLEGVDAYGILAIPKGLTGPAPVLICQHGGGGSPEVIAPFTPPGGGTGNYGWMVRRALAEGYVTWSPSLAFKIGGNEPIEGPDRLTLDKQLRHVGTSILAIELYKIQRGLDAVLKRPEVDPDRVGMMGLSYGGMYALFAAALDTRIKAAVSSCWFNDRRLYAWDDWSFFNDFNEFTDPTICGLICPRPLMIEVGTKDDLFNIEGARSQAPKAREHWEKLNIADRFAFVEFEGGHEFKGDKAYDFVRPYLQPTPPKK